MSATSSPTTTPSTAASTGVSGRVEAGGGWRSENAGAGGRSLMLFLSSLARNGEIMAIEDEWWSLRALSAEVGGAGSGQRPVARGERKTGLI